MESSLLAILVLGIGGGFIGLLAMLRGTWMQNTTFQFAPIGVALTAASLAIGSDKPLQALIPLSLIGIWVVVCWGEFALACLNRSVAVMHRPWVAGGSLLVASPLLAALWSYRIGVDPDYWAPPLSPHPLEDIRTEVVENFALRTDAGRYLTVTLPVRPANSSEVDYLKQQLDASGLICTDGPGADYNCHGWVFTGGKFCISSGQINAILEDNGYRPVAEPRAGDLIIYWSSDKVSHSGVVRSVDAGQVLVESKWGMQGRYIHTAENQSYSSDFRYYRSERGGHLLHGLAKSGESEPYLPPSKVHAE